MIKNVGSTVPAVSIGCHAGNRCCLNAESEISELCYTCPFDVKSVDFQSQRRHSNNTPGNVNRKFGSLRRALKLNKKLHNAKMNEVVMLDEQTTADYEN